MAGCVEGKVALVTGGASGIGRATALTFAREGAKLVVADTNEDGGQQTVHMITEKGGEAIFVQVDVTSTSAVEAMIAMTVETYGRLDCAHTNAGIAGRIRAPLHECPEDVWDQVLAINLKGVWLCMKYEITQMLHQGSGTIVNTASIMGLVGSCPGSRGSGTGRRFLIVIQAKNNTNVFVCTKRYYIVTIYVLTCLTREDIEQRVYKRPCFLCL